MEVSWEAGRTLANRIPIRMHIEHCPVDIVHNVTQQYNTVK